MESTETPHDPRQRMWWRWLVIAVVATMLATSIGPQAAVAQDEEEQETPDVVVPGTGEGDEGDGTPEAVPEDEEAPTEEADDEGDTETTAAAVSDLDATAPGFPAVLAQGLAFMSGERVVWQVRQVELGDSGQATESANASIVYQFDGTSVIRNELTGKRALLEPGEAYFRPGGDPFSMVPNSSRSIVWVFEVVSDTDVATDAFYESPLIDDYDEGVFDLEMIRYVLEPGQSADLPDHTGPALVMSTLGDVDVESGGLGLLSTGAGQLVTESGEVINNSQDTVDYVVVAVGAEVSETSASSPSAEAPVPDTGEEDTAGDTDDAATTDETDTSEDAAPVSEGSQGSGEYQASINITAVSELYVVVTVDGVTVFDGPIPEGGQSGVIVGSVFEVYTTSGASTMFTDACGNDFFMGYEEGEARYVLEANENSCPP